jgi:hypothetical protein
MQFEVFRLRKEGKLLPHHLRWSGVVRGDLYVREEHDNELNRFIRKATMIDPSSHKALGRPQLDVMLISVIEDTTGDTRVYQQSWILIPFDMLSATDRLSRR